MKFTLNRKFSPLLSNLAIPPGFVISMEALKKSGQGHQREARSAPGPFKFVEWKKDDHITVDAFDGYWGNKPKLQRIVFQPVPEASVRALKIRTAKATWPGRSIPKDVAGLKGQADTDVLEQPGLNVNMAEFNLKKPEFQNKVLRQALNYAVNKQELADKLYSGAAVAATGVLPPTSWAFNTDLKGVSVRPRKGEGAAQGRPATRARRSSSTPTPSRAATTRRAASWPRPSSSTSRRSASRARSRPASGRSIAPIAARASCNLAFGGWQADTGDPENFLGVFFHSANKGGVNTSFYGVPEVDQLLNQANEETDIAKRKALFNQAEREDRRRCAVAVHQPHEAAGRDPQAGQGLRARSRRTSTTSTTWPR